MARKKPTDEVNVSQEIRSEFDKDTTQKPKMIAEALSKRGVEVDPGYVSVIISQYRKKLGLKPRRRRRKSRLTAESDATGVVVAKRGRAAGKNKVGGDNLKVADLHLVKEFVSKAGSIEKAKQAMDCYVELTS